MAQSDDRVPGRGRGAPPSFGRQQAEGAEPQEDFTIRGGQAFHLVLHVDVVPSVASLDALRAAIRENTRLAVLEGYAAAFAEMDAASQAGGLDEEPPAAPGAAP